MVKDPHLVAVATSSSSSIYPLQVAQSENSPARPPCGVVVRGGIQGWGILEERMSGQAMKGEGPPVSGRPIQEGRKTKRCGARAKEALKVKMKTKGSCMGARGRVGPH